LYFYHHRNDDGLIYREERIGRKTIELYKGREDRLVYRSWTFDPTVKVDGQDLTVQDNHMGKECVILKMKQLYEIDPEKSPE